MSEKSYRDAIRAAMIEEMDLDPNVLIMGEDIGVYEGTFRITAGMLKRYGPKRVIDTPIAEAGMAGTAIGMAMMGLRPIMAMPMAVPAIPASAIGVSMTRFGPYLFSIPAVMRKVPS